MHGLTWTQPRSSAKPDQRPQRCDDVSDRGRRSLRRGQAIDPALKLGTLEAADPLRPQLRHRVGVQVAHVALNGARLVDVAALLTERPRLHLSDELLRRLGDGRSRDRREGACLEARLSVDPPGPRLGERSGPRSPQMPSRVPVADGAPVSLPALGVPSDFDSLKGRTTLLAAHGVSSPWAAPPAGLTARGHFLSEAV